jgi:hypothetical protein
VEGQCAQAVAGGKQEKDRKEQAEDLHAGYWRYLAVKNFFKNAG